MRAFVGVTDGDWFDLLASRPELEEVNFWQPSGSTQFKALQAGEIFLFKPHRENFVAGGGVFAHFSLLPARLAWESFGVANGAESFEEMRRRIERYRRGAADPHGDYTIGCILLQQPFFLDRRDWIPLPDWRPNIVRGRGYDLAEQPGIQLWERVQAILMASRAQQPAIQVAAPAQRFGKPTLVTPRLGQGSFRVVVIDAYGRRCAVTRERALPALEAAHIRPYAEGGPHSVNNGLLLRRDLHALFDYGYLTVTPELIVEVSRRIRDDFDNGREYENLAGSAIAQPGKRIYLPAREELQWHNENRFLG